MIDEMNTKADQTQRTMRPQELHREQQGLHNDNSDVMMQQQTLQAKSKTCPFCGAELSKQEGFSEEKDRWICLYCGNEVQIKEKEDMKRTINNNAQRLWKKTKPVVEFGAGLILIALGTAIAAAEYFIDRNEKKEAMDDQSYDIPEEEISENIDNNVL